MVSVAQLRMLRCRFWQCPNGKECKYRHKLPPGFKLKSEIKELLASEAANKPSLEEEIEAQRQAVEAQTPITEQVQTGSVDQAFGSANRGGGCCDCVDNTEL